MPIDEAVGEHDDIRPLYIPTSDVINRGNNSIVSLAVWPVWLFGNYFMLYLSDFVQNHVLAKVFKEITVCVLVWSDR